MRTKLLVVAFTAVVALQAPATAADDYPSRPIEIVVPYAPGGAADIIARPFASALQKELKQSVVVINRPGASGSIGTTSVARANPNGYTLGIMVVQVSILPLVDELFGRQPTYRLDQLKGIARLSADPVVVLARQETPWKSLADLVAAAKASPGGFSYSSGGNYSGNHIPMELLSRRTGMRLLNIPYKGGGPSMAAFVGGEVPLTAQVPGVAYPHIQSGAGRALVQTGAQRSQSLPDVPTARELGHDVEFYLWVGFFAPAGVPDAVMAKLDAASAAAMQDPDLRAVAGNLRVELGYQDARTFNAWWRKDADTLQDVVRAIGRVE